MKKFILSVAAMAAFTAAWAEGYQVNTLSAKQGGMGHTGVAQKLESESMFFNPAGMAFMDKTMSFSASINGLSPKATITLDDGKKYHNASKVSTPFMASVGFSIYDNLKAGIAMYIPYGSSIDWGKNWPGALLNQSVDLKSYTIQPTISWKITPRLSIGAGLMMSWGNVNLNKGVTTNATTALLGMLSNKAYAYDDTPASVNITGTSQVCWGANFGIMYDISKKWSIGAAFRTEQKLKVTTGDASVIYSNEAAEEILSPYLNVLNTQFKASMPMPWVLSVGTTYKPIDRLKLAFDMQMTGWKSYDKLVIDFDSESAPDQIISKNYHNSLTFRLGGEYAITKRFDIRAGFIVDLPPVDKNRYNPETPAMTKLEPSAGFSFRPIPNLSIDFCVLYVHGLGVNNASCTYSDVIAEKLANMSAAGVIPENLKPAIQAVQAKPFVADYKVHAISGSLGISYSF
ncbi:outer membrane protein transport protein [uncultured Muribaculum sp.]|uniref:OmpP1/FadL family transporter n=1 Tax=uncultured Muribaculum sp. TaxID=1918613 RepID=UPI0025B0ADC5|nr:outer membrane protein transport protein [uncultured Muribaculum sp.]